MAILDKQVAEAIRQEVLVRYQGRCAICGTDEGFIDVHEIEPRSLRPGDWWVAENRIVLCRTHHDLVHAMPLVARKAYLAGYCKP